VLRALGRAPAGAPLVAPGEVEIPVGVSVRHVHLCRSDADALFGQGYQFTKRVELYQRENWAAEETVTLAGPRGTISRVRVLLPLREKTQVEVSRTDAISLGLVPPVLLSRDAGKATRVILLGPAGVVDAPDALICAHRHLHMSPAEAQALGLSHEQRVKVRVNGVRALVFDNVIVRVAPNMRLEMHLDTDEANAADVSLGAKAYLVRS